MLASTPIHSDLPFGCHKRCKSHTQQNIEHFAAKIIYRWIGKKMMVEVELHLCDAFVGWKKTKFIDPNDTLQNHKLAPIWMLRTIIRHIDKSALILNGNSIPHRRIWKFLNDDDDERNIWNQPWKMDSTEIIGNDDYRKSFKELDLEVTRIECVVPIPDPFGLKVAIAINGHSSDIFFFKMEK